jgi:hypothetical protein
MIYLHYRGFVINLKTRRSLIFTLVWNIVWPLPVAEDAIHGVTMTQVNVAPLTINIKTL